MNTECACGEGSWVGVSGFVIPFGCQGDCLCTGDAAGETESLRCSEILLCSVTLSVNGLAFGKGDETWWMTGLMENRGGRRMVMCVNVSGVFRGDERSLCSRSGLASLTGERLDRNDLACWEASGAFCFATFFKSLWSLRLSFPGFGSMAGGGICGWRDAGS